MGSFYDEQSDDDKALVDLVRRQYESAKPTHDRWRENAEKRYALYRSYKQFRGDYRKLTPPDKDDWWASFKSKFGTDLFVPYGYATVETVVPRMLAQPPRMLVLPRDPASEENVQTMKALIDAQQQQIRFEMALQPIVKTGLIYGLGVAKSFWRTEMKDTKRLVKSVIPGRGYFPKAQQEVRFDDPDMAEVDPFDFFYDPYGYDMRTITWLIHRTWRTSEYVVEKVLSKQWRNIDPADLDSIGPGSTKRDDIWESRMRAAGFDRVDTKGRRLHEVWEYHDGKQVITVLNNEIVVASGPNPYWHGELPFQIYRPTPVPHEFAGIGEIEPIEDLIEEMNELRSVRRDAARVTLNMPFAYWDGLVDPDEIRFGPGSLIPVPGDPRELLRPLEMREVPGSSYQEEQQLEANIDRISGVSDPTSGGESSSRTYATATGAQLVQQAASIRIQNKTRRAEAELIAPMCGQWVALNQQKIAGKRDVRTEGRPKPGEVYGKRWTWIEVTPENLAGQFEVIPEGGSTEPDNIPQMRQDGQMLMQLFSQNPAIDQRRVAVKALELFGIKQGEAWLAPQQPTVDPNVVGQLLAEAGMDPEQVNQILQAGQLAHEQVAEGGEPAEAGALMAEIQKQAGGQNGAQQAQPAVP